MLFRNQLNISQNVIICSQRYIPGLDIKGFGLRALGKVDLETYLPEYQINLPSL